MSADTTAVGRASESKSVTASADAPNILIIVTDDQRTDTMQFMPRTERLFGRQGVTFTRAFATTPLCCPFRASLMTGQFAHNSGVRRQKDGPKINQEHTMQRYLHEAGYTTALLGKYLNHWPNEDPPPFFDRFAMGKHYRDVRFNVDGKMKTIKKYVPDYLASKAARLLRQFDADDEKPWLMMLTPSTPHVPAIAAPRHENVRLPRWKGNPATNEKDLSDKPPMLYRRGLPDEATPKRAIYERMSRSLLAGDDLVNRVFQTMRALDESTNTLAFFVSDNGFSLGEHGLIGKRKPYPIASRVPLYMRWPHGLVARGIVDDRLVANIDVLPTVLGASGLSPTAGHVMDGRSLRGAQERSRMLLEDFSSTRDHSWASLITDDEHYTEYYGVGEMLAFQEYYDVVSDPWYLTNTLGDDDPLNDPDPLAIQELSDQLETDRECAGAACP